MNENDRRDEEFSNVSDYLSQIRDAQEQQPSEPVEDVETVEEVTETAEETVTGEDAAQPSDAAENTETTETVWHAAESGSADAHQDSYGSSESMTTSGAPNYYVQQPDTPEKKRKGSGLVVAAIAVVLILAVAISATVGASVGYLTSKNQTQASSQTSTEQTDPNQNVTQNAPTDRNGGLNRRPGGDDGNTPPERREGQEGEALGETLPKQSNPENNGVSIGQTATAGKVDLGIAGDLSPIVEAVMPSIVAITSQSTQTVQSYFGAYTRDVVGAGSGVIFDQEDDRILIMTNNHVIEGAKSIAITFSDEEIVEGQIVGTAAGKDLAVVEVMKEDMKPETLAAIKVATLGDSDQMKVGQMVLAIGNALGYGQSLTVGYISALDRVVTVDGVTLSLLQTDAAINPGNSGGALINLSGEVIGINSVKFADEDVEGMGYAIPMDTAVPVVESLRNVVPEEERGFIGIYYREITDETHNYYNIPYGLYVTGLAEGGAAEKAGVQVGDIVIAVDGEQVLSSADVTYALQSKKAGDRATITVERYQEGVYEETDIDLILGEKPAEPAQTEQGTPDQQMPEEQNPNQQAPDQQNPGEQTPDQQTPFPYWMFPDGDDDDDEGYNPFGWLFPYLNGLYPDEEGGSSSNNGNGSGSDSGNSNNSGNGGAIPRR